MPKAKAPIEPSLPEPSPPYSTFVVQYTHLPNGASWEQAAAGGATKAKDLIGLACDLARYCPGRKVRICRPGVGSRAVYRFQVKTDAAGRQYMGTYR